MLKVKSKSNINVAATKIDLEKWIYTSSSEDYQNCSKNHLAMGVDILRDGTKCLINIESIGGHLMIHHYKGIVAKPNYTKFVSDKTKFYIFHLIPITLKVIWEMEIYSLSNDKCALECRIMANYPNIWLRLLSKLFWVEYFVQKHDNEETEKFKEAILRKINYGTQ